jgi:hypothetical protein
MKDFYAILHIERGADENTIRMAYKQLAKKYHPDVNKSPLAHEKFIEISEAYEFLIHHKASATDTYSQQSDYDEFIQKVRENAQRQAQMRYEKFAREHEAFQKSGINDIILFATIITRIVLVFFLAFLSLLPIYLLVNYGFDNIVIVLIFWLLAFIIGWIIYDKRKHYFYPDSFYYSPKRIKDILLKTHISSDLCYYCNNLKANSQYYNIELYKLKNIKLRSKGFLQQNVNYKNLRTVIHIPRSQKAFIVHSTAALIKVLTLLLCVIFLNISSLTWRFILGLLLAGILSRLILLFTRTKSNILYLFNLSTLFRSIFWLVTILISSSISFYPFDIETNDFIYLVLVILLMTDSLLMQFIDMIFGLSWNKPIFRQYQEVTIKYNEDYKTYNDVPVISVVYPIFRFLVG